jgi:hypothetical protein
MKKAIIIISFAIIIIAVSALNGRRTQIMLNNSIDYINMDLREDCKMRHENGNCLPCGGFCTAVSNEICCAMHNAYNHGFNDCHDVIKKGKARANVQVQSN